MRKSCRAIKGDSGAEELCPTAQAFLDNHSGTHTDVMNHTKKSRTGQREVEMYPLREGMEPKHSTFSSNSIFFISSQRLVIH